jgi:uncharacterized protein (TIGR03067 family)
MYSHFVVLAVMVAAPGPKGDLPDPASLDGEWVIAKYVLSGKELYQVTGQEIRIGGGKIVLANGLEVTYKTDKKADPAQIDLASARNKTEVIKGIYKVDQGALTLCFPQDFKGDRPAKFEPGMWLQTFTFRRVRAKD